MNDTVRTYKNQFREFLDRQFNHGTYSSLVEQMMETSSPRLLIKLNHLREFDPSLAWRFQRQPFEYLPAFEAALEDFITSRDRNYFEDDPSRQCHVGIDGIFGGDFLVTPRHLLSHFLGNLVCVEGIVTKCSSVLPKVMRTVHYCPATNKFLKRDYRDATSYTGLPTGFSYPTKDPNGNLLRTEFGYCKYRDTQSFAIQEMPEKAPAGQLPRSVEVIIEDDLVDKVKPGDRIRVVGVYRALAGMGTTGSSSGTMKTILIANNVIQLGDPVDRITLTFNEEKTIQLISKRPDCFDLLAGSIAPSIYGHGFIKKSLLLLLIGGSERVNPNSGHHIRGDINLLMVGDPSTAKSQLLRFMMHISPLSISTTGRASTGVGLTAAVVTDPDTGDRSLQAGAMVLADRGIVCVDEFDKMNDIDRVAMHEVMEQQTVTIQKAGVHTTLNARCSVIAAANPIYGQYNRKVTIQRNVGLPDSLLSRFDLVFILLDDRDPRKDKDIAEHVLSIHRYRSTKLFDAPADPLDHVTTLESGRKEEDDNDVEDFLKFLNKETDSKDHRIPINLLRKYIARAKKIVPTFTEDARESMHEKYCDLRRSSNQKTLPITARTLETIIRLSTAMAKLYLRDSITKQDVEDAFKLMEYAICFVNNTDNQEALEAISNIAPSKQTLEEPKTKKAKKPQPQESTTATNKRTREEESNPTEEEDAPSSPVPKQRRLSIPEELDDDVQDDVQVDEDITIQPLAPPPASSSFTVQQHDMVYDTAAQDFKLGNEVEIDTLLKRVNELAEQGSGEPISQTQLRGIIDKFIENELVLEDDGKLYSLQI